MRVPFEISAECMENHDKTRSEVFGFIHFEEHTRDDTGNRMKKTIKQSSVLKEKITKVFIDSKNTVSVLNIDQFKGHSGSAFHGIHVSTGRTETTVASERYKFQLSAMRAAIHGATKSGIAAIDHFFDIFHLSCSGMKSIFDFFIVVCKDSL